MTQQFHWEVGCQWRGGGAAGEYGVSFFLINLFYLFIYFWLCCVFLRFCARAFSRRSERGPLFIAVRGPLTVAACLVAEHRLQTRRLSSCGARAQLLRGMWDLPRPGLEPVSPASAGRFSTTTPPGEPSRGFLWGGNEMELGGDAACRTCECTERLCTLKG